MRFHKASRWMALATLTALMGIQAFSQGPRGLAELKTAGGAITIDYGQVALKGRDMISQLTDGMFWRMGNNTATVLKTPVDLKFGSIQVPKGSYSLWLEKGAGDKYQVVFNTQIGQWGTEHDPQKDLAKAALKKETLSSPVEVLALELKPAPNGGTFQLTWSTVRLTADFQVGK